MSERQAFRRAALPALGLLLAGTAVAAADVFVREVVRSEQYVLGFRSDERVVDTNTLWVGPGRAALTQEEVTLIVDLERNWMCYADHRSRTYVESSLPVDVDAVLAETDRVRRRPPTSGTVRPTGEADNVLGRSCDLFEVSMWDVVGSERLLERELVVCATRDVDLDGRALGVLAETLRRIHGRSDEFRAQLESIEGLHVRTVMTDGYFPWKRRLVAQAVEIAERAPDPAVYRPPEGYRRVERMTRH